MHVCIISTMRIYSIIILPIIIDSPIYLSGVITENAPDVKTKSVVVCDVVLVRGVSVAVVVVVAVVSN